MGLSNGEGKAPGIEPRRQSTVAAPLVLPYGDRRRHPLHGNGMIRSELVRRLARAHPQLTQRDMERIVWTVFEAIAEALCHGERVELRGFGQNLGQDHIRTFYLQIWCQCILKSGEWVVPTAKIKVTPH